MAYSLRRTSNNTRRLRWATAAFSMHTALLVFALLGLLVLQAESSQTPEPIPIEAAEVVVSEESERAATEAALEKATKELEVVKTQLAEKNLALQTTETEVRQLTEAVKQANQAKIHSEQNHNQWLNWLKTADRAQIDEQIQKMKTAPQTR